MENLAAKQYSAWWGTHQIQALLNAVPSLEALLKIIPGVYSAWLRLWGSKIGKHVYWTPHAEIIDRSMMIVGDQVIFGHKVGCSAHAITHQGQQLLLYVKHIEIGNHVLIGAGSKIGPGAKVADGQVIPILTLVGVNQLVENKPQCQMGI